MHWHNEWFNEERYEYLINWLSTQTLVLSYPTPMHPAFIALKALTLELPGIMIPHLMDELEFKGKWGGRYHGRRRAVWAVFALLSETVPDKPIIPKDAHGRLGELLLIWHDWYREHLELDEHNQEQYRHHHHKYDRVPNAITGRDDYECKCGKAANFAKNK